MSFKGFILRQVAKWKMKDVSPERRDHILGLMEKDPNLFKKIGEEVERRKKGGETEMKATMEVMRKYRAELTALQTR